jgi:hypothetical protein
MATRRSSASISRREAGGSKKLPLRSVVVGLLVWGGSGNL